MSFRNVLGGGVGA